VIFIVTRQTSTVTLTDLVHPTAAFAKVIVDPDEIKLEVVALELAIFSRDANLAHVELGAVTAEREMWQKSAMTKI
jgi:hypothetical protein